MKSFFLTFTFLILFCTSRSQPDIGTKYTDDFKILVESMKELYPMSYQTITKEQFESNVKIATEKLAVAKNKDEAIYIIKNFIYNFKDLHATVLSLYGDLGVDKILPFKVYIINDDLYIKNYPADPSYNGSQIISINGLPSKVLIDSLKILGGDDGNRTPMFVSQALFNSYYGAFVSQKDTFNIKTNKGQLLAPCVKRNDSLYNSLVENNWRDYMVTDHDYLKKEINDKYGYFRLENFDLKHLGTKPEDDFNSFITQANEKKVPNVIIDMRYNSGGEPKMAGRMASKLADKPFKVFESLIVTHPKKYTTMSNVDQSFLLKLTRFGHKKVGDHYEKVRFDKGLKTFYPDKKRYKGKIYVITGTVTESAATMFCKYLQGQNNVSFVGSETSGAINYFCAHDICQLKLNNIGIVIMFGTELIELKKGSTKTEQPIGLIPENYIQYSAQDVINGNDKEMKWILDDINKH